MDKNQLREVDLTPEEVYCCRELLCSATEEDWKKWFAKSGNHGSDGWDTPDEWFFDMLRSGVLEKERKGESKCRK